MRCFFCLEEREPTEEHVFPEAIGGTLKIDRVCKPCNDFLGAKVDVLLTNHELILIKRAQLGMIDRAGKAVDPLKKIFGVGKLASEPEKRIQLVPNPETGRLEPSMMYHSTRTKRDDGSEAVQITLDASQIGEVEKIIQRERKRAGQEPLAVHEIEALVAAAKQQIGTIEQPEVIYSLQIDTYNYQRGICKIIYELACVWLGDDYLADPAAEQLRNVILHGSEEPIKGTIELGVAQNSPFELWNREPKAHIAMSHRADAYFSIWVRIFDLACGTLVVTDNAGKHPLASQNQFLLIDLAGGALRQSTREEEIARMTKRPDTTDSSQ